MDLFGEFLPNLYILSDLNTIREFLLRGGNPNKLCFGGFTIFHGAINGPGDNIHVVKELIKAGADVNSRTHLDFSPLHFAVIHRKQQVVEALIRCGASINAKDFLGRTSFHFAVSPLASYCSQMKLHIHRDSTIIDRLLQHRDIDCDAVDFNGETPLMIAVKEQEMSAALQLIRNKANPNICNNDLETPLHAAFSLFASYTEIELLLSGANIYALDKKGQTPFDILLNDDIHSRSDKWISLIINITAFKYVITSELKRKFESVPLLWLILNKCCGEIDHMRNDFILDKITIHDFCMDCFNENQFKHVLQIHTPVVERLVRDIYPEYFIVIFQKIPELSLFSILQKTARARKITEPRGKGKTLADLFLVSDFAFLFSKYLSNVEFFSLIVSLSDVINVESMQNLYERNLIAYMNDMKIIFNLIYNNEKMCISI